MSSDKLRKTYALSLMFDLARYIEAHCDEPITLKALSEQAQLSAFHLQRCFRGAIGVSPKEYQESCRLRKLRSGLRTGGSVTEAIYEAGYGSPSRVYGRLDARLGMTPGQYRAGGKGMEISYGSADTRLGQVVIGATDRGVCFLQFGDAARLPADALVAEFPHAVIQEMAASYRDPFELWIGSLSDYLRGATHLLDLPLDIRGTTFQIKVWKYLQTIPPGETRSYAEVAAKIGHPKATRAVAGACARNRIALAIPCHRVIRGDGQLAGYRWGIERKRRLLRLERTRSGEQGGSKLALRS